MQEMQNVQESDPLLIALPHQQQQQQPTRTKKVLRGALSPILSFWEFLVNGNFVQLSCAFIGECVRFKTRCC
jgi:hypothetical protein